MGSWELHYRYAVLPFRAMDGELTCSNQALSEQKTLTPVEALKANGLIGEAITSYKISRFLDKKDDGQITFGSVPLIYPILIIYLFLCSGLDETKFDPKTLVTVDNVSKGGFWAAALDSASVNEIDLNLDGRTCILDTGTTLIAAPAEDAKALHAAIPGAKSDGNTGFTIPCGTDASVAFSFGGRAFTINSSDLVFSNTSTDGICASAIHEFANSEGSTQWLVCPSFPFFAHQILMIFF